MPSIIIMQESHVPSFWIHVHDTIEHLLQPYKDVRHGPTSMRSTASMHTNLTVTVVYIRPRAVASMRPDAISNEYPLFDLEQFSLEIIR